MTNDEQEIWLAAARGVPCRSDGFAVERKPRVKQPCVNTGSRRCLLWLRAQARIISVCHSSFVIQMPVSRGFSGCGENTGELTSFSAQIYHKLGFYQLAIHKQTHPILTFVTLLFAYLNLRHKICSALRDACRTIIRPYTCSTTQQLLAKHRSLFAAR